MSSAVEDTASPDQPVEGTVLGGKYRIDSLIAEGGMSFVYLAQDSSLDERVAIKVLKQEFRQEKDVLARFVREAKTIRRIHSDHCVKVLEVGMDPDHGPFMVMEYLAGKTLREILEAGGKLVTRRACELVVQVCDALAAAHTNGCIHRDIKPDNIVILSRGDIEQVRVLDFGISKHSLTGSVLNQDLSLVSTMNLMGTPMYMSPEQMRSTSGTDWRTDIWSLGAMLYEMLTGRPPFVSESITEVCSMVIEDEPIPLGELEPEVPEDLASVVHKCLQKKPADRYQNVGEVALALLPYTPRRARASVERIVSILTEAGVEIDHSEISKYPPASTDTPRVTVPAAALVPNFLGPRSSGIEVARTLVESPRRRSPPPSLDTTPAPSTARPAVVLAPAVETTKKRKTELLLLIAVTALIPLVVLIAFTIVWRGRRARDEARPAEPIVAAASASVAVPAPSASDTAEPVMTIATTIETKASSPTTSRRGQAAPVVPRGTPRPAGAAKKATTAGAALAPPATAAAPAATPPAPPAPPVATATATATSKVRLVDDAPSRPKVLD